jgi:hypothetical protein
MHDVRRWNWSTLWHMLFPDVVLALIGILFLLFVVLPWVERHH